MAPSNSHSNSSSQPRGSASKVMAVKESSKKGPKPSRYTPPGTPEESTESLRANSKAVKKKTVPVKKPEGKEKGYDADSERDNRYKLFIQKKSGGKNKVAQVYRREDGIWATETGNK
ncbi:uncharacterized protein EAE98_001620 [Botrytis deweyae]|uniref:Uncharacterized protein n=1 Tax=Botrytis deweyae TaxID=2478750 RepID=A0ABQ7IYH1_9HELO|nr:uncharacterized protein EAE98_001620 [Botrytis deweyae]KAF7937306.1 hypothetical protein EAE98_001620 [Botrytis deweyae]